MRGERDALERSLAHSRASFAAAEERADNLDRVAVLFRTLLDREITAGVEALQKLQGEGLRAVFSDQEISVRAEVEVVRGKVSVSLVTAQRNESGELVEGSSLEGFGGAVSTVQSVLLRLSLIFRRGLRPILVMDESLPAFDDRYVHSMGAFLKALCGRVGVDLLLVTHNTALIEAADRAYRIRPGRGGSEFQRIV